MERKRYESLPSASQKQPTKPPTNPQNFSYEVSNQRGQGKRMNWERGVLSSRFSSE
jgi:hypothetical protein